MKKRWITALAAFALAVGVVLPPLAADIDYFFTGQWEALTWKPTAGWAAVAAGGKPLQFYLIFCALTALLIVWILFTGSYLNYRSAMRVVTPEIQTPAAAGQGQFGTARWLPKEQFRQFFGTWKVPEKDPVFQALLEAGRKDAKEIEDADIQID